MKIKVILLVLWFSMEIIHGQNVIYIYPGVDQISNAVKFEAFPGDIIELSEGDFRYQPGSPASADAADGSDLGNKIQIWNPGTWIHEPSLVSEKLLPTAETFKLEQNYPNPFNPHTNIEYCVVKSGMVKLLIYDNAGRKVRSLVNQFTPAGRHLAAWGGFDDHLRPVPSGIYFYRLQSNGYLETKKLLLVR